MEKLRIPGTDLYASRLGLGTDHFGSTVSRELSMELMDHYYEAGGNVIDTAEIYASWIPGGEHQSEKVVGDWLRDRQVRDRIIVSTKGAHPRLSSMNVPRMTKVEIESDLDSSLERLRVDCIDLYWLHRDAPGYPIGEILQTLESFRKAGKIKHAGFSNWRQARAEEARQVAQSLGVEGFIASQNMWSLGKVNLAKADPTWAYIDQPFALWHSQHGYGAFAYLSQANGYFRRLEQQTLEQLPDDSQVRELFDHVENRARFQRARRLQEKHGLYLGQVVLGYLAGHAFPVFPLVGPKTVPDLQDCLRCVETRLTEADISFLERGDEESG